MAGSSAATTLPTGIVTFLMTDIEGSTRLWEADPDAMARAIAQHEEIVDTVIAAHGGVVVRSRGEGDSTFSVFASADDAIQAAVALQRALATASWPTDAALRARAALYTGEAELRSDNYFGAVPNRCSRLRGVAHGGQILCAQTTRDALSGAGATDVGLRDLGLHRLRDLARAERVYQVCAEGLRDDFPPLDSLDVRHNLPRQRTSFVGRRDEMASVAKHLAHSRLLTLTGAGGCGKTRLAVQIAFDRLRDFPDGVFFVDLAPIADPTVLPAAIARSVGFSRPAIGSSSTGPVEELLDFLGPREVLLVLDNCEHLLTACAAIAVEILDGCPGVRILATSREALTTEGEQVYPVPPLAAPDAELPEASDSVRLFYERASLVRPDFVLSAENSANVAEICVRLDGIPLAIELAAAQSAHLSPAQIVAALGDRFGLLTGGPRHAHRQQTLRATLDWSHGLLTPSDQAALRSLGVFPGSFSLDAAEAVCATDSVSGHLRSLVAKSLVVVEEDGAAMRYRLLESVRVYAEERLAEAGERDDAHDRHRDFFVAWAEAIEPERTYLDPDGVVQREQHNLRAALRWSEQQGRLDLVGRIASTMNRIWLGDVPEAKRWITLALQGADDLDDDRRIRVLAIAAQVAVYAIEAQNGILAERAVEAAGDRPGVWSSLAYGLLCLNRGVQGLMGRRDRFDEVEPLGAKALELATSPMSRGLASFWLGQARILTGNIDGAIAALEEAAVPSIPGGDAAPIAEALLSGLWHIKGDHERAARAASKSLEYARTTSSQGLWAWVLYDSLPYAVVLATSGRHEEAVQFLRDLLEEGGSARAEGLVAAIVLTLSILAAQRGDDERACVLLGKTWKLVLSEGIRTPVDIALFGHYDVRLRTTLDPAMYQELFDRGHAMSTDDALAYGLTA